MNKKDILEMSQNSKKDEGMEFAENQGRKIGISFFCAMFAVIILFDSFFGKGSRTFHAASAMFWTFMAAEAFPKYRFSHNKSYLIIIIAGGIAAMASLANFILLTLRL